MSKEREFWESARRNAANYLQYYNRLLELGIAMFEWSNVPDTVDVRFLELSLFARGSVLFFKDDVLGFMALPFNSQGELNQYRIPVKRQAFSVNYYADRSIDDSVIIWNNMIRGTCKIDIEEFALRLYELDRTIDVNVRAQKTPVLIKCSEAEKLTMLNMYKQFDGNSPAIFGDKGLNTDALTVLRTDAPFMARDLYELKTMYWNEALTYLGIANINVTKKERLITDEVTRNQGGTIASRYSRLYMRQKACEEINKMFGLDISCQYREDFRTLDEIQGDDTESENNKLEKGDEVDEPVHD